MSKKEFRGAEAIRFAEKNLQKIATDAKKWETRYWCPETETYWIMDYPHSEVQGGGSPRLREISDLLHGAEAAGMGVDAYCKSASGAVLISRYIAYNPPKVAAVKMVEGPSVLQSFSGSWNFKALPEGVCRVVFTYSFR